MDRWTKKKKRKKKQVLCHDSPYLSNDLVYTMSEICYACIGSCRHRYMNMKSESLSLESKQEHPISWVWAEPLPQPPPSLLLGWATKSSALGAQFVHVLPRVLCSKVSWMAVLHHHILLLRLRSGRPMGFLKITNFFSRVRADPPGLLVWVQSVSEKEHRCQRCSWPCSRWGAGWGGGDAGVPQDRQEYEPW